MGRQPVICRVPRFGDDVAAVVTCDATARRRDIRRGAAMAADGRSVCPPGQASKLIMDPAVIREGCAENIFIAF